MPTLVEIVSVTMIPVDTDSVVQGVPIYKRIFISELSDLFSAHLVEIQLTLYLYWS